MAHLLICFYLYFPTNDIWQFWRISFPKSFDLTWDQMGYHSSTLWVLSSTYRFFWHIFFFWQYLSITKYKSKKLTHKTWGNDKKRSQWVITNDQCMSFLGYVDLFPFHVKNSWMLEVGGNPNLIFFLKKTSLSQKIK